MRIMSKTYQLHTVMGYFFQEVLLLWTGVINKNIGFFRQVLLFRTLFYQGQESRYTQS